MNVVKKIRYYAAAMTLAWMNAQAFDPSVDLKDSTALAQGQCEHNEVVYLCFLVQKGDKKYVVAVGRKGNENGIIAVYLVLTNDKKANYTADDLAQVYPEPPKRRGNDA